MRLFIRIFRLVILASYFIDCFLIQSSNGPKFLEYIWPFEKGRYSGRKGTKSIGSRLHKNLQFQRNGRRAYCSRNSNNSVQTTLLKFKNFPTGESTLIVLVIVGTVVQKGSIFCNYSPRRESDRLMVLGLITGATTIEVRVASQGPSKPIFRSEQRSSLLYHSSDTKANVLNFHWLDFDEDKLLRFWGWHAKRASHTAAEQSLKDRLQKWAKSVSLRSQ